MKNLRFCACLCSAVIFGTVMTSPLQAAAVVSTIPTVYVEESSYLNDSTEDQITGEISITVYDHTIHVEIVKKEPEGIFTFYDMDLSPAEGYTATEYVFSVSYSEISLDEDDAAYTADFLSFYYRSSYTLTITIPEMEEDGGVYQEENILISNPHSETDVTGTTRYAYTITFLEKTEDAVSETVSDAIIKNGSALLKREVTFLWATYTLGDANDDDAIDITDAYLILLYYASQAAGTSLQSEVNEKAMDVNQNGSIDVQDSFLTLSYYARHAAGDDVTFEDLMS